MSDATDPARASTWALMTAREFTIWLDGFLTGLEPDAQKNPLATIRAAVENTVSDEAEKNVVRTARRDDLMR